MANGDPTSSSQPSTSAEPARPVPARQATDTQRRYSVNLVAYVQMSFRDEVELAGYIGDETFSAKSQASARAIKVTGAVGPESVHLEVRLKRLRTTPVSGRVMGQPISGHLTTTDKSLIFEGMAGEEPLRYLLDSRGACSNFDTNLGLNIVYQALYTEVNGSVDRVPDAAMIGLLLPVALSKWDAAYS